MTADEPGRRLILVRHGRTAWNADRRAQGQTDVDLDATGHEQAARMAPAVAGFDPVLLWSSDLARARDTAAYVAKETDLEPTYDARLREYHLGEREGVADDVWWAEHPTERAEFLDGDYDVVPGGERIAEVAVRMRAAATDLLAQAAPGETVVAVSHGGAIRTLVATLLGQDPRDGRGFAGLENCGWVRFEERAHGARLRLTAYNERA